MAAPRRGPVIPTPAAHRVAQKSKVGQFGIFGFLGFCVVFGTVATLLDTDAPKRKHQAPPSEWPYDDNSPGYTYNDIEPTERSPSNHRPPPSTPPLRTPQSDQEPLDRFNRRFHHRTPWILQKVNSSTQAQISASERQAAAQQRQEAIQTRQQTRQEQQASAKRREAEMDRFANSRRMANDTLPSGMETPRGRGMQRMDALGGSRQRSLSTASDYSASSYDSF